MHHEKASNNLAFTSIVLIITILSIFGCNNSNNQDKMKTKVKILFLHHSTGNNIWKGGKTDIISRVLYKVNHKSEVDKWFSRYNKKHSVNYVIQEQNFPKKEPYGWKNYPYDYYNIWVKNAGTELYMEEPTLKILTKDYDLIIWKHCFPVGAIIDSNQPDINSEEKTLENYKLQYNALKVKMKEFPDTKFLVWTGATLVKEATNDDQAKKAKEFYNWVINEWDEPGDNIYLWDFYELETEGGIYLKNEYAAGSTNSHPSPAFSKKVYPYFCQRIVDVLENNGDKNNLMGKH